MSRNNEPKPRTMLRVLIDQVDRTTGKIQERSIVARDKDGNPIKDDEGNNKKIMVPMEGGVVEDNIHEILGYVFDEKCYDNYGNRSEEHKKNNPHIYAKADWAE